MQILIRCVKCLCYVRCLRCPISFNVSWVWFCSWLLLGFWGVHVAQRGWPAAYPAGSCAAAGGSSASLLGANAGGRGGRKATWCGAGARPQPPLLATAGLARSSQETTGKCTSRCWDRNVTVRASLLAHGRSVFRVLQRSFCFGVETLKEKNAEIMINIFLI